MTDTRECGWLGCGESQCSERCVPEKEINLGDIYEMFLKLKSQGVTRDSALYVLNRVWWEGLC